MAADFASLGLLNLIERRSGVRFIDTHNRDRYFENFREKTVNELIMEHPHLMLHGKYNKWYY